MVLKGNIRQDMGSIQDVFRKRVQRDQEPAKDISVKRLWDNEEEIQTPRNLKDKNNRRKC